MKVSIGIPVYNGEKYILQAVKSVLNQTFSDFELIVTDDGSTDSTLDIIRAIEDPRLIIIYDGHNRGIAYRLNQQIEMAQGEIFVRMDADDIMMPNRLERQVDILMTQKQIDVVGTDAIIIGEHNEVLGKRKHVSSKSRSNNDYFLSARFIHPTIAGRTDWFKKWKYSENMSGNEDLDLWIRSHSDSVFYDMKEELLFYRDPYKFRLKTYLFRQKRYLKCVWHLRHHMNSPCFFLVCLCRGVLSSVMAIFFSITGQEKIMISKRNISLSKEEEIKYSELISKLGI